MRKRSKATATRKVVMLMVSALRTRAARCADSERTVDHCLAEPTVGGAADIEAVVATLVGGAAGPTDSEL